KASALHDYFIAGGVLQEIVKDETCLGIFPSPHFTETEIIEHGGIAPLFHYIKSLRKTAEVIDVRVSQKRREQLTALGLETEPGRPVIEYGAVAGVKARAVFRNDVPKPAVQWRRCGEIAGIGDAPQVGFGMGIDTELIGNGIAQIAATEGDSKPGPSLTCGMCGTKNDQRDKGYRQPYREKGIGHEQHMKRDAGMTKGFEPTGAIGVEGIDEDMGEQLYSEEQPPVFSAHRRPRPDAGGQPRKDRSYYNNEEQGMGDPPVRPDIAGGR